MKRRHLITTLATVLAAGALGACGGSSGTTTGSASASHSTTTTASASSTTTTSATTTTPADNGIASLSAEEIAHAALRAAISANTLHLVGWVVSHGNPVSFDLNIVEGRGGRGSLTSQGLSVQFILIGRTLYMNGDAHFWGSFTTPAIAQRLDGKWIQTPPTVNLSKFALITNLRALLARDLGHHPKVTKGPMATVDGQRVIAIRNVSKGTTGYVALTGPPYPIEIVGSRSHPGHLVLDRYNQPISLQPPPNVVSPSSLGL